MANFLRFLVALALLPTCWAFVRAFVDALRSLVVDHGVGFSAETIAFLGGMVSFGLAWTLLSHPVRAYVFAHELTHALWGLAFGAIPSRLRVGRKGGSVQLSKSNMLITLAPYFFPFYAFVVILAAVVTYALAHRLPCLPLWMFLIGFTWSFHLLFTLETLSERQSDITLYGRVFSWVFIFLANVALVLAFLAATTELSFSQLWAILRDRLISVHVGLGRSAAAVWRWTLDAFRRP